MSALTPTKILSTEKRPFATDTTTTEPIVIVEEVVPAAEVVDAEEYQEDEYYEEATFYVEKRKRVNIVRPAVLTLSVAILNLIVPVLLLSGNQNFIAASIFAWVLNNIGYAMFIWLFIALIRRGFQAVMDSSAVDKLVKTTGKVAKGIKR